MPQRPKPHARARARASQRPLALPQLVQHLHHVREGHAFAEDGHLWV
eukprot:CAMPEP_0206252678 /NCGR_PEP_ID=MMETSP0047_2-20121206/22736_1 /ASSEMBLY_ACC=CAM_ASM_000192 /TAXON_ID=195065 /ORGANISM="Chroomonas mesostigmatica_cf, Strain CCMP1168" /LENGTH=46 /DNA_ID= /DNA_START= /DNA_END= /DNA_ORIENTATION=